MCSDIGVQKVKSETTWPKIYKVDLITSSEKTTVTSTSGDVNAAEAEPIPVYSISSNLHHGLGTFVEDALAKTASIVTIAAKRLGPCWWRYDNDRFNYPSTTEA